MTCPEVQLLAASLIDNEQLDAGDLQNVVLHLELCSECRHEYEMEQLTALMVRARIPLVDAPNHTYQSIMSAIESD